MVETLTLLYGLFIVLLLLWILRVFCDYKNQNISWTLLASLFILKCGMALSNYYFSINHQEHSDVRGYSKEALITCESLYSKPAYFWQEVLMQDATVPTEINPMSRNTKFWEGLGLWLHRTILVVFTFLSFGVKSLVPLWFGMLSFIGQWYIFKAFRRLYPSQGVLILLTVHLLPLVAFWSPSLSKECYMLISVGAILFNTIMIREKNHTSLHFLGVFLGFLLLFMVRNFYIFSLLPFYLFWILLPRSSPWMPLYYLGFCLISYSLFVLSSYLPPDHSLNMFQNVVNRQSEFLKLGTSGSSMPIPPLLPHGTNLLEVFGVAFDHVFLRPHISQIHKTSQWLYFIDIVFSWMIMLWSLICIKKEDLQNSFLWFMLTFSVANMLFIGISVPAYGAICRYKMLFHLLLLLPFILIIGRKYKHTFIDNQ